MVSSGLLEYVGPTLLTPNNSVVWDGYRVPDLNARLLMAPQAPPTVGELALTYASLSVSDMVNPLHQGSESYVNREGDEGEIAVKWFAHPDAVDAHGPRSFQANICLSTGLSRIPPIRKERYDGVHTYRYSGPRYLGALIPNDPYGTVHPIWLMSYEAGRAPTQAELPEASAREKHFRQALGACGLKWRQRRGVRLDDNNGHNTLLLDTGEITEPRVHRLVKFDITRPAS